MKTKQKVLLGIAGLTALAVAGGSVGTMAWFYCNTTVTASGLSMSVSTPDNLIMTYYVGNEPFTTNSGHDFNLEGSCSPTIIAAAAAGSNTLGTQAVCYAALTEEGGTIAEYPSMDTLCQIKPILKDGDCEHGHRSLNQVLNDGTLSKPLIEDDSGYYMIDDGEGDIYMPVILDGAGYCNLGYEAIFDNTSRGEELTDCLVAFNELEYNDGSAFDLSIEVTTNGVASDIADCICVALVVTLHVGDYPDSLIDKLFKRGAMEHTCAYPLFNDKTISFTYGWKLRGRKSGNGYSAVTIDSAFGTYDLTCYSAAVTFVAWYDGNDSNCVSANVDDGTIGFSIEYGGTKNTGTDPISGLINAWVDSLPVLDD